MAQQQQQLLDLEFIAVDTITLVVDNISLLTEAKPISSEKKSIGGLDWRFAVHKVKQEGKEDVLDMRVYCNEECQDKLWLTKVQFTTNSNITNGTLVTRLHRCSYGFKSFYWILPKVFGQITQNAGMEFALDIKIVQTTETNLPPLDTNLKVKMGETSETLLVNKHTLAILSNYFRNLFFAKWTERNNDSSNEFEITDDEEDFDITVFKWMIYAAMTMGPMVSESNFLDFKLAVKILKLARKYDMPVLTDYCERFLMTTTDQSKIVMLELAETYDLEH